MTSQISVSLSARRAWIEIGSAETAKTSIGESLSARRAWIEIVEFRLFDSSGVVALRKESVDRNVSLLAVLSNFVVALRKESVDRNDSSGVDFAEDWLSLSARRAWIEIVITAMTSQISVVALRKESVDRNCRIPSF